MVEKCRYCGASREQGCGCGAKDWVKGVALLQVGLSGYYEPVVRGTPAYFIGTASEAATVGDCRG